MSVRPMTPPLEPILLAPSAPRQAHRRVLRGLWLTADLVAIVAGATFFVNAIS